MRRIVFFNTFHDITENKPWPTIILDFNPHSVNCLHDKLLKTALLRWHLFKFILVFPLPIILNTCNANLVNLMLSRAVLYWVKHFMLWLYVCNFILGKEVILYRPGNRMANRSNRVVLLVSQTKPAAIDIAFEITFSKTDTIIFRKHCTVLDIFLYLLLASFFSV